MLQIITDDKGVRFTKNGKTGRYGIGSVRYIITGDTVDFIDGYNRALVDSERLANFTLNGETLTRANADEKLSAVFFFS
jgi:hypothetical protein